MKTAHKTALLGAVTLALLALNLVDRGTGQRLAAQLPVIDALPREEVSRIEISTAVEKVVLESTLVDDGAGAVDLTADGAGVVQRRWALVAPVAGDADQVAVRTLLNIFRKDVALRQGR